MTRVHNYCLMVTYQVTDSLWLLAESEEAAIEAGWFTHLNGTRHHFEIERKPLTVEIIGQREVVQ